MKQTLFTLLCVFVILFTTFAYPFVTPVAAATTYQAKSYIFLRTPGPFGFGHVGWGYEIRTYNNGVLSAIRYYFGAVENPNGKPYVAPGQYNGGWWSTSTTGQGMYNVMRGSYGYQSYKFRASFFSVTSTQVNTAYSRAQTMPSRGYNVTGNNCMDASYYVLNGLGTPNLAWPSTNWTPKGWYDSMTTGWSSSRAIP